MRWAVLGLMLFFPSIASAQVGGDDVCVDGRVTSEATMGRCCWPEQTWSDSLERCAGVPRCPEGRVMDGEECVAGTAPDSRIAPLSGDGTVIEVAPAGVAAPPATPALAQPATLERTERSIPLILAGSSAFFVGYLTSVVLAIAAYSEYFWCPDRPYFFLIPVAGGVMGAVNGAECGAHGAYWIGIGTAVAQVAGIVLVALGFIEHPVAEDGAIAITDDLRLVPAAPSAELGLGLHLAL